MIILNEEKYARDVLTGRRTDVVSIIEKIDLISRYNYLVLHKNDDESYSSIVKWLEKHHNIFCEQNYSNIISKYIHKAKKSSFYYIDSIKITKKHIISVRVVPRESILADASTSSGKARRISHTLAHILKT